MLHSHESARLIPLIINQAAQGNWTTFGRVVIGLSAPQPSGLAMGVYYSVTCSESVPTIREDDIKREDEPTFLGAYRTRAHQRACAWWPRGNVPSEFYQPVHSDVPTLMLSGDIDPATPLEFAKKARAVLSNARQIILRNTAHNYDFQCARDLVVEFIDTASTTELATDCVDRLRRPSFLRELPARFAQ
jgi:pimeloyl-ACP methyl ester carboxylesterase